MRSQGIGRLLFELLIYLILLEIGLRVGAFAFSSLQERRNRISIKESGQYRILCLGDSSTAVGGNDSYPALLQDILNQSGTGIKFSVINQGQLGANTGIILDRLETNLNRYKPDMVITMMGQGDKESFIFYEDKNLRKGLRFLNSLKTYKLGRFICSRVTAKFRRATEPGAHNNSTHKELGYVYLDKGRLSESEEAFRNAIKLDPGNGSLYLGIGRLYKKQDRPQEAESALRKAIELNPASDNAYAELGSLCRDQHRTREAEQALHKALEINPGSDSAYFWLGSLYRDQGRSAEEERAFRKVIELNPANEQAYVVLSSMYLGGGRLNDSELVLKKLLELNPKSDFAYAGLATVYGRMGNGELAKIYRKKADSIRGQYYRPMTINNYRRLKEILDERKIMLVCVQYPARSTAPLREIFTGEQGVIFVDNEKIFEEAVEKGGYEEYFVDMFGGEFGHGTRKGNELLARNISDVILKELFNMRGNDKS